MRITIITESTDVESFDRIEDLMLAKAQLTTIDQGYAEFGIETPEYITDKLAAVTREINSRLRGDIEKRLRAAKARRAALMTPDEKRKTLDDEIAALESKLT